MKFIAAQEKVFWYWINERHSIYLKRKAKVSAPWTTDKILQRYKFTNVFRQLDRVTIELNQRLRGVTDLKQILFRVIAFRMFNWPATYDVLEPLMTKWDAREATMMIHSTELRKVFTGAYIITAAGQHGDKVKLVCNAITKIWDNVEYLAKEIKTYQSMEVTCKILTQYPLIGKFVAYEIACDLRYTPLLNKAKDVMTWANPGPGAMRGIHRLLTGSYQKNGERIDYVAVMRELLARSRSKLKGHVPNLEMREIEHSLCEFDKYMRAQNNEGRPRSLFKPNEGGILK